MLFMVHQPQRRATADNLFLHRLQRVIQRQINYNTADVYLPMYHNYLCKCSHTKCYRMCALVCYARIWLQQMRKHLFDSTIQQCGLSGFDVTWATMIATSNQLFKLQKSSQGEQLRRSYLLHEKCRLDEVWVYMPPESKQLHHLHTNRCLWNKG